jgi:ubiquinone/menaquinone biosynthesis C-methylase UbiE
VLWSTSADWQDQAREVVTQMLSGVPVDVRSGVVLEIGCGVGRITAVLAERAREVIALDVSPRMLELARQNVGGLANVRLTPGDGTTLGGVVDASVDLVFSAFTLQHLPDKSLVFGYLSDVARVLRPGGWLAMHVNNEGRVRFWSRWLAHWTMWLLNLSGRRHRLEHGPTWTGSRVGLAEVRSALERTRLELRDIQGRGTLHCTVVASRAMEPAA